MQMLRLRLVTELPTALLQWHFGGGGERGREVGIWTRQLTPLVRLNLGQAVAVRLSV